MHELPAHQERPQCEATTHSIEAFSATSGTVVQLRKSTVENVSMADIISPERRSALMGRIKGTNTGPELIVRRLLHGLGYRYALHARNLPGRPDIVFPARRSAIFVHGCFWHRHDCGQAYLPKSRRDFWEKKFAGNVERDQATLRKLAAAGWNVLVVWECQVGNPGLAKRLMRFLGPVRRDKIGRAGKEQSSKMKC